jgi:RNA polymerase sigma factor (sigma-70 family)
MGEPGGVKLVAERQPVVSFEEFFRHEYRHVLRAVYLSTRNVADAEDLAQEAMARAFERWERVGRMTSPSGYVYQTAMNLNRKRLRRLAVRARHESRVSQVSDDAGEVRSQVIEALASLSPDRRDALVLTVWFGLGAEESGKLLGIGPSAVRTRVHRARAELRERASIEGEGDE